MEIFSLLYTHPKKKLREREKKQVVFLHIITLGSPLHSTDTFVLWAL